MYSQTANSLACDHQEIEFFFSAYNISSNKRPRSKWRTSPNKRPLLRPQYSSNKRPSRIAPSFPSSIKNNRLSKRVLRRTSRIFVGPLATSSLAVGRFAAKQGSLRSPRGQLVASLEKQQQQLNSVVLCVQRNIYKKSKCPSQCGVIWSPLEVDRKHLSFSPQSYALRAIK